MKRVKYPCVERVKYEYLCLLTLPVPILLVFKAIRDFDGDDISPLLEVIAVMIVLTLSICALMYAMLFHTDLAFLKKMSFSLSKNLLTSEQAWESVYSGRGMRFRNRTLSNPYVALLLAKLLFDEGNRSNNPEFIKQANEMLQDIGISNDFSSDSPLRDIAEETYRHLESDSRFLAALLSDQVRTAAIVMTTIVFALFLLLQLMKIFNVLH